MISAFAVVVIASAVVGLEGPRDRLVRRGGDPARGVLVNRSPGARPFDPPDPGRSTVVFIHGFNPAPRLVHFEMAEKFSEALLRRGGPPINLLSWDWNAATFDSLWPPVNSENAVRQGYALARSLRRAGLDPASIHLVGHSAGGMVATGAARDFATRDHRTVAQLTLLDPATFYHALIFERLKAGSLAPRVENYWSPGPSAYGKEVALPGVWNYQVIGTAWHTGVVCPLRSDHLSIVNWYLSTVENPAHPSGFNTSPLATGGR